MGFVDTYNYYIEEKADPRTKDWFLVGSPISISTIIFSYLYFVLICGPRYMKDKEPHSLKGFIKFYNLFQVFCNLWIVYSLLEAGWLTTISLGCEPIDYSMNPTALKLNNVGWWAYILKVVDLIETGMFILRKKNKQISLLHLYHHVSTVFIGYMGIKYIAGGMSMFFLLINCTVHIMMYSYYFLSTYGGTVKQIMIFIKPYITIIQMVQFVILIMYASQVFFVNCDVPKFAAVGAILNLLLNFYLFYNFYQKTYIKTKKN